MTSKFQTLYEETLAKLQRLERCCDRAAADSILSAALRVINRNNLTAEFVAELSVRTGEKE